MYFPVKIIFRYRTVIIDGTIVRRIRLKDDASLGVSSHRSHDLIPWKFCGQLHADSFFQSSDASGMYQKKKEKWNHRDSKHISTSPSVCHSPTGKEGNAKHTMNWRAGGQRGQRKAAWSRQPRGPVYDNRA